MKRDESLDRVRSQQQPYDVLVIGGGATGLGTALDAASRGLTTLLLEQHDFAKGTSSRSTKLVHGGVRYLAQGDIALVREACRERGLLQKNARHLVKNETFVIPAYKWWTKPFYTIGLTMYDILAGSLSLGRSLPVSRKDTIRRLPTVKKNKLSGGVKYHDGQFDDSRLAINVAQTTEELGGTVINYMKVTGLLKTNGKVSGVTAVDQESGEAFTINAKTVVNATGVFVDDILSMDQPEHKNMVRPSQGVHLVLDKEFFPGEDALMIPKTSDGRVLFAVPWHDKVVVGTTDTPLDEHSLEPKALEEEIEFILATAKEYLIQAPTRKDVKSVFAGLRPLAAPQGDSQKTKEISRSHKLLVSESGLLTMTGGKWTTFRKMGEDTIDKAIKIGELSAQKCGTETLPIHGSEQTHPFSDPMYFYGSDKDRILQLGKENERFGEKIHADHPYLIAEVVWAVRNEMARNVEDFLARRTRVLFLDARAAIDMAPVVAEVMAAELGKNDTWISEQIEDFVKLANRYLLEEYKPVLTEKEHN